MPKVRFERVWRQMLFWIFIFGVLNVGLGFVASHFASRGLPWERSDELLDAPLPPTPDGEATETEPARQSDEKSHQVADDMLSRIRALAESVEANLGAHSDSLEAAADSVDVNNPASVLEAANKLIAANKNLRAELEATREEVRKQQEEIAAHLAEARTDALTDVPNRRAFDDEMRRRFGQYTRQKVSFSMIIIDVDYFKKFNDTHGHQAGDEVLRGVGRTLKGTVRDMDLPARYGGEEFAVILPGIQLHEACIAAERIRTAIETAVFHFEGTDLKVTASLGVAHVEETDDPEQLIKRADAALYTAKKAGRNSGYYHDQGECHPVTGTRAPDETAAEPELDEPFELDPSDPFPEDAEIEEEMELWMAPYFDGPPPQEEEFESTQCVRLSENTFSYLARSRPDFKAVLVRREVSGSLEYFQANVEKVIDVGPEARKQFRVTCAFAGSANEFYTNE